MEFSVTEEMLSRVLNCATARNVPPGSFSKCDYKFDGSRDAHKAQEFVEKIVIYKKYEQIPDERAIREMPLLLTGEATVWWKGVESEIHTWTDVITNLQESFAPTRPDYLIFSELFERQKEKENVDKFIAHKRALFAELSTKTVERTQIDMIYGLLTLKLRKCVDRSSVNTFNELLTRCRTVQQNIQEATSLQETIKCSHCRKF
ncbi:activity-regulated cytoskeleton associated protein 2-like [Ctenocephalides felis]|uniref:activity-regulated cytoskeleton associated protein 2-like n=1 Tax=Ctenocephalides felis TaxID=7515 RepID=UPI000E6E5516|nr:activity-regulated cytoskeleton associated protein 2-like [Ctenocephalides felis]